jgi:formiminotetrahydrofolate cyclodeaminase
MLKSKTLSEFCSALASSEPTPGGGSAAAAGGAMGAALVGMVAELTLERDEARALSQEIEGLRDRVHSLRKKLLELVDRDTQAFNEVREGLRLPRRTETEKSSRREALQKAYLFASEVPLSTAECCQAVLVVAGSLVLSTNRLIASDLATGVLLAHAGVHGAVFNIEANLPHVRDEKLARALRERSGPLRERADSLREEILHKLATISR